MAEIRVCEGRGCTDAKPCIDRYGQSCAWLEGYSGNVCTICAAIAEAVLAAPDDDDPDDDEDEFDEAALDPAQRVQVFSPCKAQRWIDARRVMRAGGAS